MENLTVSQIAKAANVNIETIRYYEKQGLLRKPPRTESGYRMFSSGSVARIKFIKRAQELGFTLAEVKKLLEMCEVTEFECSDVRRFALEKLREVELKIRDLNRIKSVLEDLSEKCPGQGPVDKCPILERFQEEGDNIFNKLLADNPAPLNK